MVTTTGTGLIYTGIGKRFDQPSVFSDCRSSLFFNALQHVSVSCRSSAYGVGDKTTRVFVSDMKPESLREVMNCGAGSATASSIAAGVVHVNSIYAV